MSRVARTRVLWSFRGIDLFFLAVFLLIGVFHMATVRTADSYGPDSSLYLGLAHNIIHAGTYEFNFQKHAIFPPGFPALLAALSLVGGEGYAALSRFMPVFSTLGVMVWYLVLRSMEGRMVAGMACLLGATSLALFREVTQTILSDASFFLFSGVTLLFYANLERKGQSTPRRVLFLVCACLAMATTILIRSAGISLCVAFLLTAAAGIWRRPSNGFAKRRYALAAGAAGLAAYACWTGWVKRVHDEIPDSRDQSSYASQVLLADPRQPELGRASAGQLFLRVFTLIPVQASHLAAIATRIPYVVPAWYSPLVFTLFALLAGGVLSWLRRGDIPVPVWYFTAYFGMFMIWPFDEGQRFMWPAAPLALAIASRGLRGALREARTRPVTAFAVLAAIAVTLTILAACSERLPGAQAVASRFFWPLLTAISVFLMIATKRMGPAAAGGLVRSAQQMLRQYRVGLLAAGLLAAAGLFQQSVEARANRTADSSKFRHSASADLAAWLRTADDGAVMAQQYAIVHRLSGRKIIGFPLTSDPVSLREALLRGKARYLAVNDTLPYEYVIPTEEDRWKQLDAAYPHLLQLVQKGAGYRVFAVRP